MLAIRHDKVLVFDKDPQGYNFVQDEVTPHASQVAKEVRDLLEQNFVSFREFEKAYKKLTSDKEVK